MEKKQKLIIAGVSIVVIIIIGVVFWLSISKQNQITEGSYITEYADGTKINTSEKMRDTKKIDGLEIKVQQFTEQEGMITLLGTITNTTQETKGDYLVNIILQKADGKELQTIQGYINPVEAGETIQLNISKTSTAINAYSYKIEKVKD